MTGQSPTSVSGTGPNRVFTQCAARKCSNEGSADGGVLAGVHDAGIVADVACTKRAYSVFVIGCGLILNGATTAVRDGFSLSQPK